MNEFYSQVFNSIDDAIFGQKIGFIAVTEPNVLKEHKAMGIKKVQHLVCTISKRSYLELVNTSTGIEELGIEVKAKRESFYENEKLGGLLSHLKKDPEMKYLVVKFDTDDDRTHIQHVGEAIYVDKDMNVLDNPKQYLKEKKPSGREASLGITVKYRVFKFINIAKIKFAGHCIVNKELEKYISLVK